MKFTAKMSDLKSAIDMVRPAMMKENTSLSYTLDGIFVTITKNSVYFAATNRYTLHYARFDKLGGSPSGKFVLDANALRYLQMFRNRGDAKITVIYDEKKQTFKFHDGFETITFANRYTGAEPKLNDLLSLAVDQEPGGSYISFNPLFIEGVASLGRRVPALRNRPLIHMTTNKVGRDRKPTLFFFQGYSDFAAVIMPVSVKDNWNLDDIRQSFSEYSPKLLADTKNGGK